MILDILENANSYESLNNAFGQAFDFLRRDDLASLEDGRHEIDGDRVFAIVAREKGRSRESAPLEAHRRYIDIQMVIDGKEEMGWRPLASCAAPRADYDGKADLAFFNDTPDAWVTVNAGSFVVFLPADAHAPLVSKRAIHKVVVKVAVEP